MTKIELTWDHLPDRLLKKVSPSFKGQDDGEEICLVQILLLCLIVKSPSLPVKIHQDQIQKADLF